MASSMANKVGCKPQIVRLTSVARVGVELGKIYRAMRCRTMPIADGVRMATVLLGLKACLETSEIERRIEEVEALIAARLATDKTSLVHFRPKVINN